MIIGSSTIPSLQVRVSNVQWIPGYSRLILFRNKVTLSREEFMGGVLNRGIICSVDSRVQSLVFVSESGLYGLIMQSRNPEAKAWSFRGDEFFRHLRNSDKQWCSWQKTLPRASNTKTSLRCAAFAETKTKSL